MMMTLHDMFCCIEIMFYCFWNRKGVKNRDITSEKNDSFLCLFCDAVENQSVRMVIFFDKNVGIIN